MRYSDHLNDKTPQAEPIPGTVRNSAGGHAFPVDDWVRLNRFLILGAEGGSYYASERKLTRENAAAVERCIKADGPRTVRAIVEISDAGRAPKNDPAILALAMASKLGDPVTRKMANDALPSVCRIGTHLLHFAEYVQLFGGWGRGTRRAVAKWYEKRDAKDVAYQAVKYQSRDGWAQRDLLRLAHPKAPTKEHAAVYNWIVKGEGTGERWEWNSPVRVLWAFEEVKGAKTLGEVVALVGNFRLPREAIPTQWLNNREVWEAMLPHMGLEALVRNLGKLTSIGLLAPMSDTARLVRERLEDPEQIKRARMHPIKVLSALLTYRSGAGVRGSLSWSPVPSVIDALDGAFYLAFQAVEPTNKRTLLALDVSGSMDGGEVAGVPGLTPRMGSAAMALVTAATEREHSFVAFTEGALPSLHTTGWGRHTTGWGRYGAGITLLDISPRMRLDEVLRKVSRLPFGGTDCALPMVWAEKSKIPVDTFVIYTDSETWAGNVHPVQALRSYRQKMGIASKLIVVGMVSNGFTIADPSDGGMMDVVGFDTAAPAVMADFARD